MNLRLTAVGFSRVLYPNLKRLTHKKWRLDDSNGISRSAPAGPWGET